MTTSPGGADPMRSLPDACAVGVVASDADGVLQLLAGLAIRAGHAEPSFAAALVAREHVYPTGLPTTVPVAIPHADPSHVRTSGFALATLASPVSFGVMGTADDRVAVGVVVALLVTEAHTHLEVLAQLVGLVQRDDWDASLRTAGTPAELAAAFDALLNRPG